MMPELIATERLMLRPYVLDDVVALDRALQSSPHFAEFQDATEYKAFRSRRERIDWLSVDLRFGEQQWADGVGFVYAVFRGHNFQGCVDIRRTRSRTYEFGYWLRASALGKGIAFEACVGMLRESLELQDLRVVEAHTDSANVRSRNLLLRLGLSPTGRKLPNASPGTSSTGFDEVWSIRRGELTKKINGLSELALTSLVQGKTVQGKTSAQERT